QYAIQAQPEGIAQALLIGADFIGNDHVCLILGDNIFYMGDHIWHFVHEVQHSNEDQAHRNAIIFAYHVSNPQRFGVVEFDAHKKVISIEEKPNEPKSNYVSVGLYFYPPDVVAKAQKLKPSARGEYEITDLNNAYLQEERLTVIPMQRGNAWLDAGTPDSLMDSSIFVQLIEKRQGLKLACLEAIAYKQGFITKEELAELIASLSTGAYKDYLQNVLAGEMFP
ncbi:MAG: sugar phosphate nucleotidyltransferase, partial [Anaerobiospirillum sp.]|nr:sugar phosphate nucleotidyltransferase [Anaerobiospirillum sp.]